MGVQLKPQQYFTVVRQIENHTDSSTYYVQAVIRNAYTDVILATLNLDSKGSQRFSKSWLVPADASGQGFYISIVTSVYTDSGYTTKSENYGDAEQTHLVADLPGTANFGRGGGGVSGIDSRTLRRILKEELEALKEEEKEVEEKPEPEPMVMRWDDVLEAIKGLETSLKPETPEKVNLDPVIKGMVALSKMIEDKEVTPETDLTQIVDSINELKDSVEINQQQVMDTVQTIGEELSGTLNELPAKVEEIVSSTEIKIAPSVGSASMVKKEPEPSPFNLKDLAI